jgi:hypothetical protein
MMNAIKEAIIAPNILPQQGRALLRLLSMVGERHGSARFMRGGQMQRTYSFSMFRLFSVFSSESVSVIQRHARRRGRRHPSLIIGARHDPIPVASPPVRPAKTEPFTVRP